MSAQNAKAIHPTVVEIFQSGPKRWTDRHPQSRAASVAIKKKNSNRKQKEMWL